MQYQDEIEHLKAELDFAVASLHSLEAEEQHLKKELATALEALAYREYEMDGMSGQYEVTVHELDELRLNHEELQRNFEGVCKDLKEERELHLLTYEDLKAEEQISKGLRRRPRCTRCMDLEEKYHE